MLRSFYQLKGVLFTINSEDSTLKVFPVPWIIENRLSLKIKALSAHNLEESAKFIHWIDNTPQNAPAQQWIVTLKRSNVILKNNNHKSFKAVKICQLHFSLYIYFFVQGGQFGSFPHSLYLPNNPVK